MEFKEYLNHNNNTILPEGQIKMHLKKFMNTTKGTYAGGKEMDADEFFKKYSG